MINKRSLRPREHRLTLIVPTVLLVLAGGLMMAQNWPGARWWVSAAAVGLAAVIAGTGPLWQRWRERRDVAARRVRRSLRGTRGSAGDRLPTVAEADLPTLGVRRAVIDVPYLPRMIKEEEVREHLRGCRPVVLVGTPMVGKTRLAAEVVKDLYSDRPILIPDDAAALNELDKADQLPTHRCVIWLDHLEDYLNGGELKTGLVLRLAKHHAIIATLNTMEWERLQPIGPFRLPGSDTLGFFKRVDLVRERDQPRSEDLERAMPDAKVRERIQRIGIGEYVGAAQHITDQLTLGAQSNPLGYALVLGAVDWKRAGLTRPVPADLLRALAAAHLSPRQRAALDKPREYKKALKWATREVNPTVSLLEPGDGVFTVYDYALDQLTATDEAPPAETWQLIIRYAKTDEMNWIGLQAARYGLYDVAELCWRRGASAGDIGSMRNLTSMLHEQDPNEAQTWYRRLAEAGDLKDTYHLGLLLHQHGKLDEAETWYRRAADMGLAFAMHNLGVLLEKRGDLDGAETWLRRAVGAKGNISEHKLGLAVLLQKRGKLDEAEIWRRQYQRAVERRITYKVYDLPAPETKNRQPSNQDPREFYLFVRLI